MASNPRQAHPFLLAVTQVVDGPIAQIARPDRGQRLLDARGDLVLPKPQVTRPEGDILVDGGAEQLVCRILKDHADAAVEVCRG
jgi:hypothetical protein